MQVTLWAIPQGLQAQVDPSIEWKEIETETGFWIFDAKHQELAEYSILQFERAKEEVLPLFKEPPRKTTFILLDNTDLANGSARVTPHPIVNLLPVKPAAYSAIGEFQDSHYELMAHEYTHILNMEPVHGWISPMYWLFGSIAHPNMILPRWYTEGLATYTESILTKEGGRLNSQYLQGLARALSFENRWEEFPLSDLNDSHPDWIGASRAYLFGGILWDSITEDKGNDVIYKMNQSYSRRIPFFLDGVLETHVGKNYVEQLQSAYERWDIKAKEQIKTITSVSQLHGQQLNLGDKTQILSPKISSDGMWMAYITNDLDGTGHINLTLRHPKKGFRGYKPKRVISKTMTQSLAWHPAATGFVYEKLERYEFYNRFYDLYFYDLKSKKSKRLTKGLRAHDACFTPLGKTLYFLSNTAGSKKILSMDWVTQNLTEIYSAPIGYDLRHLNCNDNDQLYFVEHPPGKKAFISSLQLSTKTKETFFNKAEVHYLENTHLGLLFSSPMNGVDNFYLLDKDTKKYKAITNSVTRVLKADIDPLDDSLYYSQLTVDGPKIFYLKGAQWESLPDQLPQVESLFQAKNRQLKLPSEKQESSDTQDETKDLKLKTKSFSPWRYLYPNHWIPFLYVVDGGTIYQAQTSAGDPLGINNISATGQWDTLTKKPGASFSYLNNSLPVSLGVGVSDFYNYFYATKSTLHYSNATALLSARLPFLDFTRMQFKWNYSALEFSNQIYIRQGPQLELSYRNMKQRPRDISASSGWKGQLGHRNFLADLGTVSYGESYGHLGTYWSNWLPERHVFYAALNGSYAPKLNNSFFATSTLAGPFFNPQLTNATFLQRGYPTGIFIARNIVNTNLEYRFPLLDFFKGWTSPPLFFRNLQGSFIFDASTLDGRFNNSATGTSQFTEFGRWFTGYGMELEAKVNVGFHVPIALTLGLYYGEEQQSYGGFTTFFNLRL